MKKIKILLIIVISFFITCNVFNSCDKSSISLFYNKKENDEIYKWR